MTDDCDDDVKCILADEETYKTLNEAFLSEVNGLRPEVRSEPRAPVVDYEYSKRDIAW